MLYQRIVLAVSAVTFAGIGFAFLTAPHLLLPRVHITAPPGTALADIRAVYGGLDLGVGLFLCYCLMQRHVRLGLAACVLTLFGLAAGRILGIVLNPEQDSITYYLLATELIGGALAGAGLAMRNEAGEQKQ